MKDGYVIEATTVKDWAYQMDEEGYMLDDIEERYIWEEGGFKRDNRVQGMWSERECH